MKYAFTEQQDIAIQRTRAPMPFIGAVAAMFTLDFQQLPEKQLRLAPGPHFQHGVDEVRLFDAAPGRASVKSGMPEVFNTR